MKKHFAFASLLALISADIAFAQSEPFRLDMCESRTTSGWSFYCRPTEPEPEKETVAVPQAPPPVNKGEVAPENPATEAMMAYRTLIDETKYRAVLDPTEENVRAYMEINKEIGDRAGAFTDQWQRILFETPHLNANVDSPLAEAGIGVYQDQMLAAREATFQRVANEAGILFIFEADQNCGICRVQGEILTQLEDRYGVNILAVSMDGGGNASFPNAFVDNGRLQELGLEDYPAPTLALADPETGGVAVIGSGLITADEILERVFVITEIPVGERY